MRATLKRTADDTRPRNPRKPRGRKAERIEARVYVFEVGPDDALTPVERGLRDWAQALAAGPNRR